MIGQKHAVNTLISLRKGDASRGALVALAAFLTSAGTAVPLLPHETLSALLFLAGAALALVLLAVPANPATNDFRTVKSPPAAAQERRLTPSPALFAELFQRADAATLTDRAALARLTAQMSHELRTPLNAVLGFSELIANEVCGPLGTSCYAGYARDIHASGRILLKSAEDALAITSLLTSSERRLPRTSRLNDTINDAILFHADDLRRDGITLNIVNDGNAYIIADAQTVRQLMVNLIADLCPGATPGSVLTIVSRSAGETIEVGLELSGAGCKSGPEEAASFSLTLARTLAELAGSPLTERITGEGSRTLTLTFASAVQSDFFGSEGHAW
jgi:two-component system cell cycle sensor histidine kinase PleC